jgi:prepilin-type N-terminal cleavage/methylation domain-containing protein
MLQNIKKRESGFTIIEVLIVLAIAGLIMLIVFLAVPALQRNTRNNERKQEGSRLATAANDFVVNSNGTMPTSGDVTTIANLAGQRRQLTQVDFGAGTTGINAARIVVGTCGAAAVGGGAATAANTAVAVSGARTIAVQYGVEPSGQACTQI